MYNKKIKNKNECSVNFILKALCNIKKASKIVLVLVFLILAVGCDNKQSDVHLVFSNETSDTNFTLIHTFEDDVRIFSEFSNIEYENAKGEKMPLSNALDKNLINVDNIIVNMKHYGDYNDGGSKIYKYEMNKQKFSNSDFMLVVCKTVEGNNNIVIGKTDKIINKCSEK